MAHVLVLGQGKLSDIIAFWLAQYDDYTVTIADNSPLCSLANKAHGRIQLVDIDYTDSAALKKLVTAKKVDVLISCVDYQYNKGIAELCYQQKIHYFDVTRDVETAAYIENISKDAACALMPQCGLAPGIANVVAYALLKDFDEIESLKIRVGSVPVVKDNNRSFALSPSGDGLHNAYVKTCRQIIDGTAKNVNPLEDIEQLNINGVEYEAFNTSGGIGSLYELLKGKIKNADFKSLRYPGYCKGIKDLQKTLETSQDFQAINTLLGDALPTPADDRVVIYIDIIGTKAGQEAHEVYTKEYLSAPLFSVPCRAIELTTAACVCAAVDLVLANPQTFKGYVAHQDIPLDAVLENRFGAYFVGPD